jgi:thiol-disulfide isomerase/thioredoxin
MSSIFLLLITAIAVIFLLLQWVISRQCQRNEGKVAPDTSEIDDLAKHPLRVYYFYSGNCEPCRKMTPLVDQLREQHTNLIKVNISEHAQLARDFGAMGVPCFILVIDGRIAKVKLGRVSESWLTQILTE